MSAVLTWDLPYSKDRYRSLCSGSQDFDHASNLFNVDDSPITNIYIKMLIKKLTGVSKEQGSNPNTIAHFGSSYTYQPLNSRHVTKAKAVILVRTGYVIGKLSFFICGGRLKISWRAFKKHYICMDAEIFLPRLASCTQFRMPNLYLQCK